MSSFSLSLFYKMTIWLSAYFHTHGQQHLFLCFERSTLRVSADPMTLGFKKTNHGRTLKSRNFLFLAKTGSFQELLVNWSGGLGSSWRFLSPASPAMCIASSPCFLVMCQPVMWQAGQVPGANVATIFNGTSIPWPSLNHPVQWKLHQSSTFT